VEWFEAIFEVFVELLLDFIWGVITEEAFREDRPTFPKDVL